MTTPITVLVADDEILIRDAVSSLLGLEDDLEAVARAASGPEAVALARQSRPQVAVLDLQMPGLDGIEVTEQLRDLVPDCRCIIVTSHARPGYLKAALAAGARAFLPKTTSATVARLGRPYGGGRRALHRPRAGRRSDVGRPLTPDRPGGRRARPGRRGQPGRRHRRPDRPFHEAARTAREHGWI